jgi:hypothetical protein
MIRCLSNDVVYSAAGGGITTVVRSLGGDGPGICKGEAERNTRNLKQGSRYPGLETG